MAIGVTLSKCESIVTSFLRSFKCTTNFYDFYLTISLRFVVLLSKILHYGDQSNYCISLREIHSRLIVSSVVKESLQLGVKDHR